MTHCHASSLVLPWVFLENKCNGRTLPEKSPSADLLNGPKDALLCFSSPQKTNGNLKEETCSCSTTSSSLSLTRSASLFFSPFFTLWWSWQEISLGLKWGETRRSSDLWTRTEEWWVEHQAAGSSTLRTTSNPGSPDWVTYTPAWVWIHWWCSDGLRVVTANECLQLKR